MKKINKHDLSQHIHFPKIRAIPDNPNYPFWKRIIKFFTYRRRYIVLEDYVIWCEFLKEYIFIPKGFPYDGASVPKILNFLYTSTGLLFYGACPHDFGYRYTGLLIVDPETGYLSLRTMSKCKLDRVFNSLCAIESGLPNASRVATFVLSLFGYIGWIENRIKKCNLYNDFPEIFIYEEV